MDAYFKILLETSFLCSGIILLIGLASPLIGKRHTAHWRYFLWILLSVRLLLPFDMTAKNPAVVIPVMPAVEKFQDRTAGLPEDARLLEKENTEWKDNSGSKDMEPSENLQNSQAVQENENVISEDISVNDRNNRITVKESALGIWAFIGAILLLWQTAVYFIFQKKVQKERHFLMEAENIPVYYCSCVATPMLVGLLRPQILLPEQEYTDKELSFILSHEMTHYHRKDLLVKLLLAAVKILHWFNPFVYLMEKWAWEDIELLCDMQVVHDFSREEKKSYSEMLLSCANGEEKRRAGQRLICSSEFSESTQTLKKRFSNIFNGNGKKKGLLFTVLGGLVILSVSIFISFGTENDDKIDGTQSAGEETQTPQDTESPKPLFSIPELSIEEAANAIYGAVEPQLIFISSKRAVIYDYWGLLIYDVERQRIEKILDLPAVDLCHIQGDTVTHIEVSNDGNQILIYNEPDTKERYVYYIDDKRLEFSDLTVFEENHYDGLSFMEEKGYILGEYDQTAYLTMDSLATEEGEAFHPENMQSLSLVVSDRKAGNAYVYPIFQEYYEEKGETAISHRYWKDIRRELIWMEYLYLDGEGWYYYLETDREKKSRINDFAEALEPLLLVREKAGKREILEDLIMQSCYMDCPVIFTEDRIVYKAAAQADIASAKAPSLVSIALDGSDRKVIDPPWHTFDNVCEDNGYIYYTGCTNDGTFPRPLCRVKADFSEEPRWVMDLPGLLCAVQNNNVYYKADSTKKPGIWIRNLKTGAEEIYDKDGYSAEELSYFNSREKDHEPEPGDTEPEYGFRMIMEISRSGRDSYYFYKLPFKEME